MDGRLKMLPSEHHGWILVETSAPLCCNLKTAQAHLVTGERGRCSADRMMYHLIRLNDNFISHLCFHCEILPAHFSPWQLLIEPNVSQANQHVSLPLKHWHHPLALICWLRIHAKKRHILACAHAFHCEFCLSKAEVIFCKKGAEKAAGKRNRKYNRRPLFGYLRGGL